MGLPIIYGKSGGSGLDAEEEALRVIFLRQEPVEYRGYLVKPMTHANSPFYIAERSAKKLPASAYTGYIISRNNANAAPGAVWFQSVGQAKTFIDVLIEMGGEPPILMYGVSRETRLEHERRYARWAPRFWEAYYDRIERG